MKITSKAYKRTLDHEPSSSQVHSSTKVQSQRQNMTRPNYNQRFEKSSTVHTSNDSAATTKTKLKKGPDKESKCKHPSPAIQRKDSLREKTLPIKSPSPPPLPAPPMFISSHSKQAGKKADQHEDITFGKTHKLQSEKGKQDVRPIKGISFRNRDLGKIGQRIKASTQKYGFSKEKFSKPEKSKISLPYDNDFCCDDDKFHLIAKDCRQENEVSKVLAILKSGRRTAFFWGFSYDVCEMII